MTLLSKHFRAVNVSASYWRNRLFFWTLQIRRERDVYHNSPFLGDYVELSVILGFDIVSFRGQLPQKVTSANFLPSPTPYRPVQQLDTVTYTPDKTSNSFPSLSRASESHLSHQTRHCPKPNANT